jgi:hypothetical protein
MKIVVLALITAALSSAQITRAANGQIVSGAGPQPSSFECAVDGTVVNSITGEPVVRARVNVTTGGVTSSATTDNAGRWTLTGIPCGTGQLVVIRTGFLQSDERGVVVRGLSLIAGSPTHDLQRKLVPQSVAVGKVQDNSGDPVMGAQVIAMVARVQEGRARFQQAGVIQTNDLGEYRLAGLGRGRYIFCVHVNQNGPPPPASQPVMADTCYPGPVDGGMASALDLPAGHETKVDFTLSEVVPVHVRGTVSGLPEGRGSGINLVRRVDNGGNASGNVRDGAFDIRAQPGSYMLTADYFEAGKRLSARLPVDVGSTDIDGVVVHFEPGFTVTGNIHTISQSGQMVTPQFALNLRPAESFNPPGQLKWDQDHTSFALTDMLPGSYKLNISPPPPYYVKSATLAGEDILDSEIPISQAAGPIEIVLRDDGGSIEGDVADASGQPVGAAGILLLRGAVRVAGSTSQANGHFKFQNLPPGDYTISAWDQANDVEYADQDWMRRNATGIAVTVTSGQNTQIKLTEQFVPR